MRAPRVLVVLAAILALAACTSTYPDVTVPSPQAASRSTVKANVSLLRNYSDTAVIYGGVSSPTELGAKLKSGDASTNGQVIHSGEQLSTIYRLEAPVIDTAKSLEGYGFLKSNGDITYNGKIIATDAQLTVRSRVGTSYPTGFTHPTAAEFLHGYGVKSLPVIVYGPSSSFEVGIVTAGGEIIHAVGYPKPPGTDPF